MEAICERNNMKSAIKRVIKNKGAPGVDGMTVRKIKRYLNRHWTKIEKALLDGWNLHAHAGATERNSQARRSPLIRDSNGVRSGDPASGGPDL